MPHSLAARERLIVALDLPSAGQALALVDRLSGRCLWFKVGLELYTAAGPAIVETLARRDFKVFLDLKLHDIPNTVASAVRSLASSGASLLTVHAAGGSEMLTLAAAAGGPRLLAVTVLTSMDAVALKETGVFATPREQVLRLARLARAAGVPDLVCSAEELGAVRDALGPEPLLVVPGIRSAQDAAGDQRRVATPGDALEAGASMLVVGRPITRADDPERAVEAILAEMEAHAR